MKKSKLTLFLMPLLLLSSCTGGVKDNLPAQKGNKITKEEAQSKLSNIQDNTQNMLIGKLDSKITIKLNSIEIKGDGSIEYDVSDASNVKMHAIESVKAENSSASVETFYYHLASDAANVYTMAVNSQGTNEGSQVNSKVYYKDTYTGFDEIYGLLSQNPSEYTSGVLSTLATYLTSGEEEVTSYSTGENGNLYLSLDAKQEDTKAHYAIQFENYYLVYIHFYLYSSSKLFNQKITSSMDFELTYTRLNSISFNEPNLDEYTSFN